MEMEKKENSVGVPPGDTEAQHCGATIPPSPFNTGGGWGWGKDHPIPGGLWKRKPLRHQPQHFLQHRI